MLSVKVVIIIRLLVSVLLLDGACQADSAVRYAGFDDE